MNTYPFNVLKVMGLNDVGGIKECYLGILKLVYGEFPRGYVEPHVLLFLLYGTRHASAQQFFLHRLPPEAVFFIRLPWGNPDCGLQVRMLFALLHLCFASYPNIFIDEYAFDVAYNEFEKWRNERE